MRKPYNTDSDGTPVQGLGTVSEVSRIMDKKNTRFSTETILVEQPTYLNTIDSLHKTDTVKTIKAKAIGIKEDED